MWPQPHPSSLLGQAPGWMQTWGTPIHPFFRQPRRPCHAPWRLLLCQLSPSKVRPSLPLCSRGPGLFPAGLALWAKRPKFLGMETETAPQTVPLPGMSGWSHHKPREITAPSQLGNHYLSFWRERQLRYYHITSGTISLLQKDQEKQTEELLSLGLEAGARGFWLALGAHSHRAVPHVQEGPGPVSASLSCVGTSSPCSGEPWPSRSAVSGGFPGLGR